MRLVFDEPILRSPVVLGDARSGLIAWSSTPIDGKVDSIYRIEASPLSARLMATTRPNDQRFAAVAPVWTEWFMQADRLTSAPEFAKWDYGIGAIHPEKQLIARVSKNRLSISTPTGGLFGRILLVPEAVSLGNPEPELVGQAPSQQRWDQAPRSTLWFDREGQRLFLGLQRHACWMDLADQLPPIDERMFDLPIFATGSSDMPLRVSMVRKSQLNDDVKLGFTSFEATSSVDETEVDAAPPPENEFKVQANELIWAVGDEQARRLRVEVSGVDASGATQRGSLSLERRPPTITLGLDAQSIVSSPNRQRILVTGHRSDDIDADRRRPRSNALALIDLDTR